MTFFIQKCYKSHCGVRLHGQNACYVILLPNTGYTWTQGIATHFIFVYDKYWEYVIECDFAVEGHIILKIWLILRIKKKSSCGSLSTSNIEYGDIMIGFFSILQIFAGKFSYFQLEYMYNVLIK